MCWKGGGAWAEVLHEVPPPGGSTSPLLFERLGLVSPSAHGPGAAATSQVTVPNRLPLQALGGAAMAEGGAVSRLSIQNRI